MFYSALVFDDRVLLAKKEAARAAPGKMGVYVRGTVKPHVERRVNERLKAPGPVVYPFEFGTLLSQQAYFASDGFGEGIPSKRREKGIVESFVVDVDLRRNEGFMVIRNTDPAAIYVIGEWQIPGHARSGWGDGYAEALDDISDEAGDEIVDGWHQIVGE